MRDIRLILVALPNGMPNAEEALIILNETKSIFYSIEKEIVNFMN